MKEMRDEIKNNFLVSECPETNEVNLTIFGTIEEPEEYINELSKLRELSNANHILTIYINSNGGSVHTLVSLLSIMKLYTLVITLAEGIVASAAFMLWSKGDVRVTFDHTIFMAHRESYGLSGNTLKHSNYNKVVQKTLGPLFKDCMAGILTKKEINDAQTIDVFLNSDILLKRKKCITYEKYIELANNTKKISLINIGDNFWYSKEDGSFAKVLSFEVYDEQLSLQQVFKETLSDIFKK